MFWTDVLYVHVHVHVHAAAYTETCMCSDVSFTEKHPRFSNIFHSMDVWHKACKLTSKLTEVCITCTLQIKCVNTCLFNMPVCIYTPRYLRESKTKSLENGLQLSVTTFGTFVGNVKEAKKK